MNTTDTLRLREWLAEFAVIGMICISVTAPAITFSPALPFFKVEQLLLPLALIVHAWLLLAGIARPVRMNAMYTVGVSYCICSAVSIWYGAEMLGHTIILRDFYELPKVLLPVVFFALAYEADLQEASLRRLVTCFSCAILPVCVYAWAQFGGLGFTYRLNPYYSSGGHIDQALQYARRVYATMGNPNVLGQLMTWCVVLFVLAVLFRVGKRWWNALVASACLVTLAMTGSRFGLVAIGVGILLTFALVSSSGRRRLAQVAFLLLLTSVFSWAYLGVSSSNRRTFERYQTLRNPLQIDSLRQRLDDVWQEEWGDFIKSPFVGHGPAKALDRRGFYDSEYFGVLKEKGLLGLVVFLGYYLYPLYLLCQGEQAVRSKAGSNLATLAPASVLAVHFASIAGILALIMNTAMSTFYSPFLQAFLWLWLGLGARSARSIREAVYCPGLPSHSRRVLAEVPEVE